MIPSGSAGGKREITRFPAFAIRTAGSASQWDMTLLHIVPSRKAGEYYAVQRSRCIDKSGDVADQPCQFLTRNIKRRAMSHRRTDRYS